MMEFGRAVEAEIQPRVAYGKLVRRELLLIDVRECDEWTAVRVPGAEHVCLANVAEQLQRLTAEARPVAFICATGQRSAQARDLLNGRSANSASSITGGIRSWTEACLPLRGSHFDRKGSP